MKAIPTILKDKRVWIAASALVVLLLVYRNGSRWWQQLTKRDRGNYAGQDPVQDNPAREAELEKMAMDAYAAIHGTVWTGGEREIVFERIYGLNDTELRFVAQYYADSANPENTSLKTDIDNEFMPTTDVDERVIARLSQLAL